LLESLFENSNQLIPSSKDDLIKENLETLLVKYVVEV